MFFLCFFRALGFTVFLPFGKSSNSFFLRIVFAFTIATLNINTQTSFDIKIMAIVFEISYGIFLSFPLIFLIETVSLIGEYFDIGRGLNIGSFYDPFFSSNLSINSKFARHSVWTLIVFLGGFNIFSKLIIDSYDIFPVISSIDLLQLSVLKQNINGILLLLSKLFLAAFIWSIPFLAIFLLIDFFIAFFGKIIPQLQIQQESFILKTFVIYSIFFLLSDTDFIFFINSFLNIYPKIFGM